MNRDELFEQVYYRLASSAQKVGEKVLGQFVKELNTKKLLCPRKFFLVSSGEKKFSDVWRKYQNNEAAVKRRYSQKRKSPSQIEIEREALSTIKDIARARVTGCCLLDVKLAHEILKRDIAKSFFKQRFRLDGNPKPVSNRFGYRAALHQDAAVHLQEFNMWFPFELQFHTLLQHTWAEIAHPVYAHPGDFAKDLKTTLKNLSDDFDTICQRAGALAEQIEGAPSRK